jgi:exodeoxyribonuclease V gamma subunit
VLSPSREYYGDLRPTRGRRAERRQLRFEDAGFRSEGHALLGSLGRHAREFQELLEERTQYVEARSDLYQAPPADSLLHVVQADLLALRARGSELPRVPLAADDESITIHACHSPMRELEVLHDQLVHWVAERGVQPHEILVMTPDISAYAKVIDAVFSQPREQRPPLPFRIADRGVSETQALWLALDALLDVLQSRFGANQVLDLLGFDLIRERFAIGVDQVETLRAWLDGSGVRWGIDGAHRASVDQPACHENSWRFGLQRLALGYSTAGAPEALFAGCAPAEVDSGDGVLLGNFMEFCEALFALRARFAEPADAPGWRARFGELLTRMFGEHEDDSQVASDRKLLREALRELDEHAAHAGFSGSFELESLRSLLAHRLGARAPAQGFLSGGVTFCQLMPMRSIPFKVLCLIGLHDGVFPASDTPFAFDLMQQDKRRLGDRSRRDDDRQLFLEALLCARDALIVTFVGQSQRDGKPLPPSVLVHELIDHAANSCDLPGVSEESAPLERVAEMEKRLLVRHPLTSGSPRYFGASDDPRLFSYAAAACKAAVASGASREREVPFARMAPAPLPELRELRLSELERCLMRPSREFCQRRLGLYLGDDVTALAEREPFALNHLERWHIGNQWLEQLAAGNGEHDPYEVERARGRLPLHVAGELLFDDLDRDVAGIRAARRAHAGRAAAADRAGAGGRRRALGGRDRRRVAERPRARAVQPARQPP